MLTPFRCSIRGTVAAAVVSVLLVWWLVLSLPAVHAEQAQVGGIARPAAAETPRELVAPDIPGVIQGGTKVVLIRDGFQGTEAAIAMPDGSLLFAEYDANRIVKI